MFPSCCHVPYYFGVSYIIVRRGKTVGRVVRGHRMYSQAELSPIDLAEETGPGRWSDQSKGPVALCGQDTENWRLQRRSFKVESSQHSLVGSNRAVFLVAVSSESFTKGHHQYYVEKAIDFGI